MNHHLPTGSKQDQTGAIGTSFLTTPLDFGLPSPTQSDPVQVSPTQKIGGGQQSLKEAHYFESE